MIRRLQKVLYVVRAVEELVADATERQKPLVAVCLQRAFGYAEDVAHILVVEPSFQSYVLMFPAQASGLFLYFSDAAEKGVECTDVHADYFHDSEVLRLHIRIQRLTANGIDFPFICRNSCISDAL